MLALVLLMPISPSRVRLVINRGQLIQVQMRITLRRRQTGVAKKLLNHSKIGAAVQQVGGKAVAQPVRTHLDLNPGQLQMLFDDPRHTPGGNSRTAIVEKHHGFAFAGIIPPLALLVGVAFKRLQRHAADRNNPFFRTFADNSNYAELNIDVRPIEPNQLADTNPGGIKNFQHRQISNVESVLNFDATEQLKDIVDSKKRWQPAILLGRVEQQQRILFNPFGRQQKATKAFQRSNLPSDRTLLAVLLGQESEKRAHHVNVDFPNVDRSIRRQTKFALSQKALDLRQVAQVVAQRMRRNIALAAQMFNVFC